MYRGSLGSFLTLLCLMLSGLTGFAQTGSPREPVRYGGGVSIDLTRHDGRLRPAIGVEHRQVMRANRTHPEMGDGFGWTYNHAHNLAYWKGSFYLQYLSNPVGEHIAPGRTLVSVSADGRNWAKPVEVFPRYELPGGEMAMMHQRMGFYISPDNRLLILGFYGHAPRPFREGGIGRVVRERYPDGTFGPIYFIRYNANFGWDETNTSFLFYRDSPDTGFVQGCDSLLENKLITQQWWDESRDSGGFFAVQGPIQALSFFHRKDGKVVGLWKHSLAALSADEGHSWSSPVKVPTFIMSGAKFWGQRTEDGRYALVYNPVNDSLRRYPLAIVTGDDGILFDDMLYVHAEVPPRRFAGKYKDFGPQYVRGIVEGNGDPPGDDMWVCYSVNKEDMWVSRVPVSVRHRVEGIVEDDFESYPKHGPWGDWNIYNPIWAQVALEVHDDSHQHLALHDRDPYDYSQLVRVFEEGRRARLSFKVRAEQNTHGKLEIDVLDRFGNRPVRLEFGPDGWLKARLGSEWVRLQRYQPESWMTMVLTVDCVAATYSVTIAGKVVLRSADFGESVKTVERISFRTGTFREEPTRRMDPEEILSDLPAADEPVEEAVFRLDDVRFESEGGN